MRIVHIYTIMNVEYIMYTYDLLYIMVSHQNIKHMTDPTQN